MFKYDKHNYSLILFDWLELHCHPCENTKWNIFARDCGVGWGFSKLKHVHYFNIDFYHHCFWIAWVSNKCYEARYE